MIWKRNTPCKYAKLQLIPHPPPHPARYCHPFRKQEVGQCNNSRTLILIENSKVTPLPQMEVIKMVVSCSENTLLKQYHVAHHHSEALAVALSPTEKVTRFSPLAT